MKGRKYNIYNTNGTIKRHDSERVWLVITLIITISSLLVVGMLS
jgi:hypothetical protein